MPVKPSTADWLQYTHLEKLYGYLPGMPAALPTIFDISDEEYEAVHRTFEAAARAEAEQLRQHPEVGRLLDRLPFAEGERVLAVGDSLTDDLQSWAEILRHLLAPTGVVVINAGLSAHTSAPVVDLVAAIGDPPDPELQGPDGVHPSLAGQSAIATAVLHRLADLIDG